ncbi:MAG: cardiolipin synthase [Planctomycetota bacterium]
MLSLILQTAADAPTTPWHWVAVAVALLGELLAIVFVAAVIARGGAPASTLLWAGVILLAPWIGLLLYYLFPRRLQLRRLRRLRSSQERWRGELRAGRGGDDGEAVESDTPVCRLLQGIGGAALSGGNRARWLPSGEEFFSAVGMAIADARAFVHLEIYIFRPDATGRRLLELLAAAARRGVEVRLLYDSFGSWGLGAAHLQELLAAGGKAVPFLPLLWRPRPFTVNLRNHRKVVVVDGRVAFTGGRNVGDEYARDEFANGRAWHDAMVQVEGPVVTALHEVFAEDWYHATDEELNDERWFPPQERRGHDTLGVVASGPDRDRQELWMTVFQALAQARERIELSSPYLVPPPTLLFALKVAAARGVRVRVHTNGPSSEAVVLYHAQRSYYQELVDAGVEILETGQDYNHAKVLVVDDRTVMIGTANLDMRSAHLNFEVAIAAPDSPDLARAVLATLDRRARTSTPVGDDVARRPVVRRIVDGVCRLLSPLL